MTRITNEVMERENVIFHDFRRISVFNLRKKNTKT